MALVQSWRSIFVALLVLTIWASQATARPVPDDASMAELYNKWMLKHGRKHINKAEKDLRFKIFSENVQYIKSFNEAGNTTYKLGINEFADLTNEEFRASGTGFREGFQMKPSTNSSFPYQNVNLSAIPPRISWRAKGAVYDNRNQHRSSCASAGWAFSAVAAVEGINQIKTGKLIKLSEQQLVNCDTKINKGCRGGTMNQAFEYIIGNKGITSDENYPYRAVSGKCDPSKASARAAKISGYHNLIPNSEQDLLRFVAHQPVSVAIDSRGRDFQFYKSGVFTGKCGVNLDHGMTVIGYDEVKEGKYWIVKNSYGVLWGEGGNIRMLRGALPGPGLCGIAKQASIPIY